MGKVHPKNSKKIEELTRLYKELNYIILLLLTIIKGANVIFKILYVKKNNECQL